MKSQIIGQEVLLREVSLNQKYVPMHNQQTLCP